MIPDLANIIMEYTQFTEEELCIRERHRQCMSYISCLFTPNHFLGILSGINFLSIKLFVNRKTFNW